jgi:two-component system OmpR family sensor kinase
MTLRLRLLLLLVGIVAAGLAISGIVTYNALRSFLTTRVDQQLEAATVPVSRALLSSSGLGLQVPGARSTTPRTGTRSPVGSARGSFPTEGGLFGGSTASQRGLLVTPGTYGQLRSSSGKIEAHLFFSYGGKAPAARRSRLHFPVRANPAPRSVSSPRRVRAHRRCPTGFWPGPCRTAPGSWWWRFRSPIVDSTLRQLLLIELIVSAAGADRPGDVCPGSWCGGTSARSRRSPRPPAPSPRGTCPNGCPRWQRWAQRSASWAVAFNTMVDEIEVAFADRAASEDRLRRFLADASHELRTPLTAILGPRRALRPR